MKRTKKQFIPYNEYQDRPFGLKWGTAFAMDELTTAIDKNNQFSQKNIKAEELMSPSEIDEALAFAYLKNKPIEIQLNQWDKFGRLTESIRGDFKGECYEDYFVLDNQCYRWEEVRSVKIIEEIKWSHVVRYDNEPNKLATIASQKTEEESRLELLKDEFYQAFFEDELEEH
ncbi:hypothetical protein [Vagococcus zengguangii]|uniref:Uncharacterized protein n=1 Tax=Vagococcus zengguangii TaxID=2571750 RepID=A0A4D7CR63_9ENTE|nr:hypothetical protein [Vagococcus zengguangii]QCI86549.1 hypothetical protein FA707_06005 [Vagococcus zengguangii]TLG81201.1 hypothetical protein FE258_01610 [Vagococcus zengguangii]